MSKDHTPGPYRVGVLIRSSRATEHARMITECRRILREGAEERLIEDAGKGRLPHQRGRA